MAEFPQLTSDGRNWTEYHEKLEDMLTGRKLAQYITGMETTQHDSEFWRAQNNLAKRTIVVTIHPFLAVRIHRLKTAREGYETLKSLFKKLTTMPTATTRVLDDIRNNGTARDTAYSPETTNDRVCRHSHITDMSRRDDDVSDGSSRQVHNVPSSLTRSQHQWEMRSQGRVDRRRGIGEKGKKSNGKADEKVTTATGPGNGATDHKTGGVSLVKPMSREKTHPQTQDDTPPPPSLTTPSLLVLQTAPTTKRPAHQQGRNSHVPCNGTCRTREDGEGSRGRVDSSSRGSRADDKDGDNDDVHHAHAMPQGPHQTCQTAIEEATDTVNPDVKDVRPMMPAGTSNGLQNESNDVNEGVEPSEGEKGERDKRVSGDIAPSSNGKNTVPDSTPPPPYPDESRPPPSMSLEGEMSGKQSSDHADEAATHLERPPDESTTTPPVWTLPDEKSSGEGRGTAMSHREAVVPEMKSRSRGVKMTVGRRRTESTNDEVEGGRPEKRPGMTRWARTSRRC
ncbi:hypothetical protein BDN67DRAFT_1013607 [Paxillus ammoniavirescens]|nr:hypothetical protein BDN67DRAFT_1013607 [Paxillus ammoniavirescens]